MKKLIPVLILVVLVGAAGSSAALAQGGGAIHYVARGESLTGIATQYGVSMEALMQYNGLANPDMIYVGQPLVIPGGGYGGPGGYAAPPSSGCNSPHTVRMGETLSSISGRYNVPIRSLMQSNNLYNQDMVYMGQVLCIPVFVASPQPAGYPAHGAPAPAHYHTVAPGETLTAIAARYGVRTWDLAQANQLRDASYIWVGQRLTVPGYQPGPVVVQKLAPAAPPVYDQGGPDYAAPPPPPVYDHPPAAAPKYKDGYDDFHKKPAHKPAASDKAPPAPEYQAGRAFPLLPEAEDPVTVIVNGGETWADEVYSRPDPDGITTLIVQTGQELGKTVRVRSGDYEVKGESEFSAEFGAYRFTFRYIPPGDYDVWIDDPETPSETTQVEVEPGQRVDVFFSKQVRFQGQTYASPDGWYLADWENPSKPGENIGGWSNILVKTPASGLNVMIESEGGGYKAKCFTGSKGPGACDFAGLMAGIYFIWIDGTDLTLKTYMDGAAYATFEFARQ